MWGSSSDSLPGRQVLSACLTRFKPFINDKAKAQLNRYAKDNGNESPMWS